MTKRLKLRISRVIPSFQSCRSKHPSHLPANPVPSSFRLSPVNTKLIDDVATTQPPSKPRHSHSSLKRHVSSAITSVGCGFRSRSTTRCHSDGSHTVSSSLNYSWQKEEKWHVIAKLSDETPRRKIYNSSVSGASDDDDGEETDTLVSSSRSFSTDSLETILETPRKKKKKKNRVKKVNNAKRYVGLSSPESGGSPARLSVFQRLIPCKVDGKVRESFAVVKKSEDPYEDFRRSMMEMILEKQMCEEKDLEQLLHCFLSLNSRDHHGVIVEAFSEIWEALFCKKSSLNSNHVVLRQPRK